jgi:hypothetical protein
MTTVPFTISASIDYPPDDGQPVATRGSSVSGSYESKEEKTYKLEGTGTQDVDFGTVALAKAIFVEVDADSSVAAQPITLSINGGTDVWQIAPGGFLAYANPSPIAGGISSAQIAYTTAARVHVRVVG